MAKHIAGRFVSCRIEGVCSVRWTRIIVHEASYPYGSAGSERLGNRPHRVGMAVLLAWEVSDRLPRMIRRKEAIAFIGSFWIRKD